MKQTFKLETKHFLYAIIFLLLLIFLQTCGVNSKLKRTMKKQQSLIEQVDTMNYYINNNLMSKEAILIQNEIVRYNIINDVLYDQNAIVRTVYRPDDRMRYYQLQLDSLQSKYNKLK